RRAEIDRESPARRVDQDARLESSAAAERITGTDEPNADAHRPPTVGVATGKTRLVALRWRSPVRVMSASWLPRRRGPAILCARRIRKGLDAFAQAPAWKIPICAQYSSCLRHHVYGGVCGQPTRMQQDRIPARRARETGGSSTTGTWR